MGATEAATAELGICKSVLMSARTIYASVGDEQNATDAMFNLAHQIYYHREFKEAKELTRKVIEVAGANGDAVLLQKAKWLMTTLETGKIPAYEKGERRVPG